MATGLPTSKTEVEFTAGVWTDVTTDARGPVTVHRGRATEFDTLQPGSMNFTLENIPNSSGIPPYTPNNPLGPYWPNVVENKRVRQTLTKSAVDYVPFIGWITKLQPQLAGELNTAAVQVACTDLLGVYANRPLKSDYAEQALVDNDTLGVDLFLFDDGNSSTTVLANTGNAGDVPATVIPGPIGSSYSFGAPQGINMDGGFAGTPVIAGGTGTSFSSGPVVEFTYTGAQSIEFWVTSTAPTDGTYYLLDSLALGVLVGMSVSGTDLVFIFGPGPVITTTVVANDGLPHHIRLIKNGSNWDCYIDDVSFGHGAGIAWTSGQVLGHLGGYYYSGYPQAQYCPPSTTFAGLAVQYDVTTSHRPYALQNQLVGAQERFLELTSYSPLTPSTTVQGSDDRLVIRTSTVGSNILAELDKLVTTIQGSLSIEGSTGVPTLRLPDAARPTTVAFTVTLESDDDAPAGLSLGRGIDIIPTRVSVSAPTVTVNVINTAAETAGAPVKATSVTSASANADQAGGLANALLVISPNLRLEGLGVDLMTAQNDLYATVFGAVLVGSRVRVANVPSGYFGVSYIDEYVQGYTLTVGVDQCGVFLDATPADSPSEGYFVDSTYGRFASEGARVTGGTCVGGTGTGTVIVTTDVGPTFSTAGGDYSMDLDWNGERITVTVPGGSTSPQTFTVTARGVAPTVARVHAANEAVDVFLAARFAI